MIYPANGLEINFLGLPMLFNDGKTENTLQIVLTNNNFFGSRQQDRDRVIVFSPETPIHIWFVVDVGQASADAVRSWALTSNTAFHDQKVALHISPNPGKWHIARSELSGSPLNESLKGWVLNATEELPLFPGQSLLLTLSGLTTDLPDGPTSCYCKVDMLNLDEYREEAPYFLKTIGPIIKSKTFIAGDRVGIGTGRPGSTLDVNGAVRARGGEPGASGSSNNGFFFNGRGDEDSGMTSLEDGELALYANNVKAVNIQEKDVSAAGKTDRQVDMTVLGDLHITQAEQGPSGGNLTIASSKKEGIGPKLRLINEAAGKGAAVAIDLSGYDIRKDSFDDIPAFRITVTDDGNYSGDLVFSAKGPGPEKPLVDRLTLSHTGNLEANGNIKSQGRIQDKAGDLMPVGAIVAFGGSTPPEGWLLCNGQSLSGDSKYDELRHIVGSNVPNLRDRFIVGAGNKYTNGNYGGSDQVALNVQQMPAHNHKFNPDAFYKIGLAGKSWSTGSGRQVFCADGNYTDAQNDSVIFPAGGIPTGENWSMGGTQAHENRPPYYALTYIIKY